MNLTPQQAAAVAHTGTPALVVAGAGSGKTRTLTAKVAHLIDHGMLPERILAITFTNKAADEMKRRLMQMTGLPLERFPWVRTFHSACLQILKRHCDRLGFRPPLQVFAEYQQQKLMREILVDRMNIDKKHVGTVLGAISKAKNSAHPAAYIDAHPRVARIRLEDCFRLFNEALKSANAVDFDDILLLTRDLLQDHADIRDTYSQRFDYLLVDEYQDTNNLQEELARLLVRNGNLFCVGDDWQAIYSFRGSNIDHFLTFTETYPDAAIFRLEQNFRSADEIVQLANELIGFNKSRVEKTCFSKKNGGLVDILDFADEREEARWVARKMWTLHDAGLRFEDMAVLYRTRFSSLAFEQALRAAGIPYQMLGGRGFFERKEIMDINCYLSAAAFPRDDASFERVINTPKRGIGAGTLKKINQMRTANMSLQDAARQAVQSKLLSAKLHGALTDVLGILDALRELSPGEAVREVVRRSGYDDHLIDYCKGNREELDARRENIDQLIYTASQKESLVDYLEEAALIREDREDEDGAPRGANLSTVHAAKGLEFTAVFVVACEEQLFPHWRSLERAADLEEERRLMYVSITRAERYLYLTSANYRRGQYSERSRFIDEIADALPQA